MVQIDNLKEKELVIAYYFCKNTRKEFTSFEYHLFEGMSISVTPLQCVLTAFAVYEVFDMRCAGFQII